MTKTPSNKFNRLLTTVSVRRRHKVGLRYKNKLKNEIIELEKQLKLHPLGQIILKAKIEKRRKELQSLTTKNWTVAHLRKRSDVLNKTKMRWKSSVEAGEWK